MQWTWNGYWSFCRYEFVRLSVKLGLASYALTAANPICSYYYVLRSDMKIIVDPLARRICVLLNIF